MTTRTEAVKFLRKQVASAFDYDSAPGFMTTGSLAVDIITGRGGFPMGRLSEVFGWEYSGKTTLCLSACAAAQAAGLYVAYIDAESGVDLNHAARLGFVADDEKKGLYLTPNTFEETVTIVTKLAETGEVPLIVVDSVPGMVPQSTFEADIDATGRIGEQARLLASTLPRLTKTLAESKTALVLVNQMRKKISTGWQPAFLTKEMQEESSGGSALKFFASLRIDMSLVKKGSHKVKTTDFFTGKDAEVATANLHRAKILKNKTASPYRDATFSILFNDEAGLYGIDNVGTMIGIAVSQGLIKKTGSHYKAEFIGGDNFSVNGEEALYDFIRSRPDLVQQLWAEVKALPAVVTQLTEV